MNQDRVLNNDTLDMHADESPMTDLSAFVAEPVSDEAVVSDLSAFMAEPASDEAVVSDLSGFMAESASDEAPVMADLSAFMAEPASDEVPAMPDLSAFMAEPTSAAPATPPPALDPTPNADLLRLTEENLARSREQQRQQQNSAMPPRPMTQSFVSEKDLAERVSEEEDVDPTLQARETVPLNVLSDLNKQIHSAPEPEPERKGWGRRRAKQDNSQSGHIEYVSPKASLSRKFRHYIETRWYPQWKYYDQHASYNKRLHIRLQTLVALFSVTVPIIIGINFIPQWIPALLSGLVAVFTAIENVMKYGDNWRAYRSAAEGLNREKILYETMSGPYSRTNAPFRMFVERCEDIIAEETGRSFERGQEEQGSGKASSSPESNVGSTGSGADKSGA